MKILHELTSITHRVGNRMGKYLHALDHKRNECDSSRASRTESDVIEINGGVRRMGHFAISLPFYSFIQKVK